jgi:inositol-phosphate phosphatase / L-galactose 1-phosphate phosphatase / histidinol-phosphatase
MTPSDKLLDEWLHFAHTLADAAHALLAPAASHRFEAHREADPSFVTSLDEQIEARLRELIGGRYPDHGILGEEAGARSLDAEAVWILDPIDGTAPFVAGLPAFGTLIALAWHGVPVLGMVHLPVANQRYVGATGRSSSLNGRTIRTRACADLSAAILTTSNPDFLGPSDRPVLDALRKPTAWRTFGGCCMSYGLVAAGRADLAIDAGLALYDYAAFRPLIEGAGGVITDWQGRPITLASGSQVLAAGDAARHGEALALIAATLP